MKISFVTMTDLVSDVKQQYELDLDDAISVSEEFEADTYDELVNEIGEDEASEWVDLNYSPIDYTVNDCCLAEGMFEAYSEDDFNEFMSEEDFDTIAELFEDNLIGENYGGEFNFYLVITDTDTDDRVKVLEKYYDCEYDFNGVIVDFKLKD